MCHIQAPNATINALSELLEDRRNDRTLADAYNPQCATSRPPKRQSLLWRRHLYKEKRSNASERYISPPVCIIL
ncbi:hypothetical protein M407DRAFT_246579, partial [Tulasnella calospora MUT 4182]